MITRNLETALHHLRSEHSRRILWIDSICINQADVFEVNIQVQRMWAIYENSRQVLIFLGPKSESSEQALHMISEISQIQIGSEHERLTRLLDDPRKVGSWQGLLHFLQRPWWSRAWIIQEYALARTAVFLCGFTEMPDEVFGKALEVLVDYRFNGYVPLKHQYLIRHVAATPIHHLWSTRRSYQTSGPDTRPSAMNILYRFRGSKAFDPRDKIYSLYKLIAEKTTLAPDYTKSVNTLYVDVVKVMIETSGTLEILSHHNSLTEGLKYLPTWCPDWTVLRGKRILLWPNEYQAAGDPEVPAFFRMGSNTLTLKGKILDQIKWLKAFESDDFKNLGYIYQEIKAMRLKAWQHVGYKSDATCFADAFQRTLVAARIRKSGPSGVATVLEPHAADVLWRAWSCQMKGKPYNEEWSKWYNDALYSAICGRAFIVTENGALGLVDGTACIGDTVGVVLGGRVPLALRQAESLSTSTTARAGAMNVSNTYELVGEW